MRGQHVVMFSGGIASWATARRVVERYGIEPVTLLFCDTRMEDEDLYRFLDEATRDVGAPLVRIADGRTPWEVFRAERMMGNHRIDPCSKILKRELGDRWLREHRDPAQTTVHMGFDWTEGGRYERAQAAWAAKGWRMEALLAERPYRLRSELVADLRAAGIEPPRLYEWATHNNCGGFCIKAGIGHFVRLLEHMPVRYRFHEQQEQDFRELVDKDVAILRDRSDGGSRPLTLRELRTRHEEGTAQLDLFDIGGCGCMEEPA